MLKSNQMSVYEIVWRFVMQNTDVVQIPSSILVLPIHSYLNTIIYVDTIVDEFIVYLWVLGVLVSYSLPKILTSLFY